MPNNRANAPYPQEIPGTAPAISGSTPVIGVATATPLVVTGPPTSPTIAIVPATDVTAGSMSAADKAKLDSLTGTTTTFIFRPGGVAGGNVYTSEAALAAATQTAGGPYILFWDLSLVGGFYTFETVGVLDLAPLGIWTDGGLTAGNGSPAQYSNQLTFSNGTVMPNPPSDVYGCIQIECNQPYPNRPWSSATNSGKTTMHDFTGAWTNAGMAPLFSSANDWTLIVEDGVSLNFGPVASGPLPQASLDYLLQVNLEVVSGDCYVGPLTINFGWSATGNPFVDPSNYPFMSVGSLFVDPTGTGNTVIPAPDAGTVESSLALLFVQGGSNLGTFYYSNGTAWVAVPAPAGVVESVTAGTNVTVTGTAANPIINASGGGGGFTPAYGSVQNTSTTSILGGSNASFNITAGPSAGVAQGAAGLTVVAAGTYQYFFQVRGTPTHTLTPPAPLVYALSVNVVLQSQTQFASDTQSVSLSAAGTEAVTGQGLVVLAAGAVVALSNQTESGVTPAGDTGLASVPLGGTATVNVQLSLVRVA